MELTRNNVRRVTVFFRIARFIEDRSALRAVDELEEPFFDDPPMQRDITIATRRHGSGIWRNANTQTSPSSRTSSIKMQA